MKQVKLIVNDKEISVPEGTLLIDACDQHGIYIPRFCYHEGLFPSGNCRMCLVKIEKNPKPVPACMTPVAENMVVSTETPEIVEMRKAILEFILINHPLDCPICDKAGECMLQDQYQAFSGESSKFKEDKIPKGKLYHFSERIIYDAERCITCTRCVRFTRDISKTHKLGIIKRGDRSYVALAPGDTFDDAYSLCVTDICPVGALTNRQFRFKERVWNLEKTDSICAGCARGCNISLQQRNNKILRTIPRFNPEVNQYWMCDFGRDYYLQATADRLTGARIEGNSTTYENFVTVVADVLKNNAADTAFILSSHATNEELAAAQKVCAQLGIQQFYSKADRVWQPDSAEVQQDEFLIVADKTPNQKGVEKYFPAAQPLSGLESNGKSFTFVWGPNVPAELLEPTQTIVLTTVADKVTDTAKWVLAGRTATEKSGSFTNFAGVVQSFRQAIIGEQNYDDLAFFNDLLKVLTRD